MASLKTYYVNNSIYVIVIIISYDSTDCYCIQLRQLHSARGGARAPTFTNGCTRGTVNVKTANKKLTKLY